MPNSSEATDFVYVVIDPTYMHSECTPNATFEFKTLYAALKLAIYQARYGAPMTLEIYRMPRGAWVDEWQDDSKQTWPNNTKLIDIVLKTPDLEQWPDYKDFNPTGETWYLSGREGHGQRTVAELLVSVGEWKSSTEPVSDES